MRLSQIVSLTGDYGLCSTFLFGLHEAYFLNLYSCVPLNVSLVVRRLLLEAGVTNKDELYPFYSNFTAVTS